MSTTAIELPEGFDIDSLLYAYVESENEMPAELARDLVAALSTALEVLSKRPADSAIVEDLATLVRFVDGDADKAHDLAQYIRRLA